MKILPLVLWLLAYSGLPLVLLPLALIFCFEGAAAWRTHPEGLLLAVTAGLFLVAWPLSVLAGWLLLILGRLRAAWIASVGTALPLLVLWICGLALIVLVEKGR